MNAGAKSKRKERFYRFIIAGASAWLILALGAAMVGPAILFVTAFRPGEIFPGYPLIGIASAAWAAIIFRFIRLQGLAQRGNNHAKAKCRVGFFALSLLSIDIFIESLGFSIIVPSHGALKAASLAGVALFLGAAIINSRGLPPWPGGAGHKARQVPLPDGDNPSD